FRFSQGVEQLARERLAHALPLDPRGLAAAILVKTRNLLALCERLAERGALRGRESSLDTGVQLRLEAGALRGFRALGAADRRRECGEREPTPPRALREAGGT
ncbi:MAG: hypothetical protein ACREI7_06550, partial [Myxococcota bacterium]